MPRTPRPPITTIKAKTDEGKATEERLDAIYEVLKLVLEELRAIKGALKK